MKKAFIIVITLLLTNNLIAQKDTLSSSNNVSKKWHIYTSPLQALDLFSVPKSTLGFEYIHNNTYGYSIEFGIKNAFDKIYGVDYDSEETLKEKSLSARIELKLYDKILFMKNNYFSDYLGLEYRYLKIDFNELTDY